MRAWAIAVWLALWQAAAMLLGSDLLLPAPLDVLARFAQLAATADFWARTTFTLARILAGFSAGFSIGLACAACAMSFTRAGELFAPAMALAKSVPVACFVVLALIWTGASELSVAVAAIVVAPIAYENVCDGVRATDARLLEMARVLRVGGARKLSAIYIPQVMPYVRAACASGLGMAWKAGVAAEIIAIPRASMGEALYSAKIYFDTLDVFAWTLAVVCLSVGFEKVAGWLLAQLEIVLGMRAGARGHRAQTVLARTDAPGTAHPARAELRAIPPSARTSGTISNCATSTTGGAPKGEMEDYLGLSTRAELRSAPPHAPSPDGEGDSLSTSTTGGVPGGGLGDCSGSTGDGVAHRGDAGACRAGLGDAADDGESFAAVHGGGSDAPSVDFLGVGKSFGGVAAFSGVSFAACAGYPVCLMAPSGFGKTTLLRMAASLEVPDEGEVRVPDGARVSMAFQEDRLIDHLDGLANARLALRARHEGWVAAEGLLDELGVGECAILPARACSGGQRRRIALARAMLAPHDILLLDEPFAGLDDASRVRAAAAIRRHEAGRIVIVATHDVRDADLLDAKIVRLDEGC